MQPRQHRAVAMRGADLDSVVFLAAILGAVDVQLAVVRPGERQPRRRDGGERRFRRELRQQRAGGQDCQPLGRGVHRHHHQRGQQLRGFCEPQRRAVRGHVAAAVGEERPLHRRHQVRRRVRHRPEPRKVGRPVQPHPRQIAVIDPRLQRLGPARGDGQHRRSRRPQRRQPVGGQRFHRRRQMPVDHDRQPHPQIGPRPRGALGKGRDKAHRRFS